MSTANFIHSYHKEQPFLMDFALQLTRDQVKAQDLVQDTLYKAYKYRRQFQPETNWKAWLLTIMRNTFINDYRKVRRRQDLAHHADQAPWVNQDQQVGRNDGEANMSMEEILTEVDRLEDWMRVPFLLHVKGYKYEEIAEELGIPLGTVKSRIYFARQRLRSRLSRLYPD